MAVTFVASSAVATGDNPTVAVPAGYAEKDLLIIVTTGTATPATPSGWTARSVQGSNGFLTILTKFATSSESSVTLSLLGTTTSAVMLAYRGAAAIDTISGITNTASGTSLAPGQTGNTSTNDCEISVWVADNVAGTWGAAPSPTTSRVTSNPTTAVNGIFVVDETQAASGNSTARTATITNLHNISALAIAVIPSGRYWVGGTGTWNTGTTTNWSQTSGGVGGAKVPTANDPVFFDQAGTYTVTMTGALTCYNLTVSAGTVTFATGTTPTLAVSGSMSLIAGTVWNSTGTTTFNSTRTAGETITTNGTALNGSVTFNGVGGAWSLTSALTTGATQTTTLTNGALSLNGYDLTTGIFSSTNANTRSIAFGANYIILAHTTAAQTVLSMATATGFTYTSSGTFGSGTGCFQATMSTTRTFTFGTASASGTAANAPILYLVSGASVPTITSGSWFREIDFGTTAFTIAATNLNLSSLKSNLSTSVLTALTATMVGTGSIRTNTSIGPLVINTSAITTTLAGTTLCTTAALTLGTLDLAGNTLTCSSTFTYNGGSLLTASGVLNCTTFTINGPAFNFTTGTITPSTSFVLTSGSFTLNGGTLSPVPTFTHTAGTVTFNSSYSLTVTGTYTLTAGVLTLADGVTLTTGIFSSNNSNTRSIAFGSASAGNINLTHTTAATVVLAMTTVTGFSYTGPGGFTVADMANTRTLTFGTTGGSTANAVNVTFTTGASVATLTTGGWYKNLTFGTTSFNPGTTSLNIVNSVTLSATGAYLTLTLVPQANVTYTFNSASFGPLTINTTFTVTMGSAANCTTFAMTAGTLDFATYNLTCSAAVTYTGGTFSNFGTLACTTFTINGPSFSFSSGTINPSTSFVLTTGSFTYGGTATLGAVPTFTHTAGTATFNKNYALTVTGTYTLTAGTLTLADGVVLTTGIFSSTGAGVRSIGFGSTTAGNINLTHTTAATTVLSMATATGFTLTGAGGFIAAAMSNTRTFNFGATAGGSVTNAPSLTFTTGASVATLTTASWFDNLNFGTTAFNPGTTALNIAGDLTLSATGTYTTMTPTMLGTGTITSNNNTTLVSLIINSTSGTTTLAAPLSLAATSTTTLTSGTLALNSYNLTTGIFSSSNTNTRSIAFGGSTPGTSASFNGSTQYASYAINSNIQVTANQPFTVEFWLYTPTQVQTAPAVFGTSNDGGQTGDMAFFVGHSGLGITNQYGFYLAGLTGGVGGAGTTSNLLASTGNYIKNAWTHIALVRVGTDALYMYINGVLNATATYSGAINFPTNTLWVGTSGNSFPGSHYTGYISNFRWVTGVAVYTGNFAVPTAPLTATQSSGTNISAITGTQTSILLNTVTGANILADSSTNNYTPTNNGSITGVSLNPFTGLINLAHTTAAQTVLSMATASSFTYTGTGGFAADATVTRTYTFGTLAITGAQYPNLSLTGSGTAVQTFTTASFFTNLSFGTTAFNPGTTALNIYGSLTLSSGGTFTTLTPTLLGTGTLTSNSNTTLAALTINASAGTITLGAAFALAATGTTTLTAGTLDLGGFDLTTGIFSSSGATTRSIVFGTNNIVLAHTTAAQTVLSMATVVGFTFTGTGGFTATAAVTRTYSVGTASGGSLTTAPNLTLTGSGTAVQTFTSASWFKNLSFGTTAFNPGSTALNIAGGLTLSSGGSFAVLTPTLLGTGTLTSNSNTTLTALTVNTTGTITLGAAFAMSAVSTFTLTAGTLDLGGFDLTTGIFSSDNTNTRSVAFGTNNIVLAHTTAATTVLNMAIATAFTYTGTGGFAADATVTRTYVFGTTGGSATISPNLTLTGTGTAIATITTASWFNTLDFGSTAFTIAATALNLNGLTLSTGGTFTNLTPTMVGTGTITTNGKTLPTLIVNTTGTATLAGALTLSGALTLTQGTLACLTYAVSSATFASTGTLTRSMTGSGTYTITGAGATAFSNASATGITIVGLIISMTAATAKTFAGGGGSYSTLNQGGAGALTISGDNSLSDLTATTRPSTITFTASSTQTFADFTLSGVLGSLVTINSSAPGTQTTLSKASGTVSVGYLSIRDSIATGGAGWYAGTTSTNVSNNLGWIFTAPGSVYLGNFFAFF